MSTKDTGGSAFPHDEIQEVFENKLRVWSPSSGMTLRDYFAAKALQGIIALQDGAGNQNDTARYCYEYADAMLTERNK